MANEGKGAAQRIGRTGLLLALVLVVATVGWWGIGRVTADGRRLVVVGSAPAGEDVGGRELRVLAWNLAHGRGTAPPGLLRNWRGGSDQERAERLARIAGIIRGTDPDVVVLNEIDFRASWSGGVNQAELLARATGLPVRVEQRNYDVQLPFLTLGFGNALLTRLPVADARFLRLPPHSELEERLAGAKAAAVVRLDWQGGPVVMVPVHLEARSEETRLGAADSFEVVRSRAAGPTILAGDFNSAPPGWAGVADSTVLGRLLDAGWNSPRARAAVDSAGGTYPARAPERYIDWILVEPPLRVTEARVVVEAAGLSDHLPVLARIRRENGGSGGGAP